VKRLGSDPDIEARAARRRGRCRGAFLALALVDSGHEREAAAIALEALAPHLPRYQRSLGNYARALMTNGNGSPACRCARRRHRFT
jgi:hypothetical protein